MLGTLILLAFVETAATGEAAIRCEFPGADSAQKTIRVVLEPRPSLKDQPGLFRVMMKMNEEISFRALARPIDGTEERDIMIRGRVGRAATYTLGFREDGTAALNMQTREAGEETASEATRIGACRGYETHMRRWLPS